uniref:ORF4 n=1 Tax=Rodent Torque teno virus 1 TaxID=1514664 RepID=X2G567_9VIRU|nr:ORF4 [Rodent Torque teno virus 1]
MVANPARPLQWEWPTDGEYSEKAWKRITRPIEKMETKFSALQTTKKRKKKAKSKRQKKEIHNQQTRGNQPHRILRILNRGLCV